MLYYNAATNQINLLNDNATAWLPATLGAATTIENSQCSLNVAATTVDTQRQYPDVEYAADISSRGSPGQRTSTCTPWMKSGSNSGWQQLGTWNVMASPNWLAALSVTPASGSGTSQTFTLQYYDSSGAADLTQAWVYFNATLANPASHACMLYYNGATKQINLLNDSATAWQAATPGAPVTLQNSQCSLNVASATVEVTGSILTWNLPMTFTPAFAGAQNVYMHALDVEFTSLWQQYGTWTVP